MKKRALITGVTGQDGAYLTRLLREKGYAVFGLVRRSSVSNTTRLTELLGPCATWESDVTLLDGDMTDSGSLVRAVRTAQPDEIYNLAAQSHVRVSFEEPEVTAEVNGLGVLKLLEAVRTLGGEKTTRIYQASTSELFGAVTESPQTETTPFRPQSPYGAAKLFAYWTIVDYRHAYGMFAANGILFNHESPLRGESFLTRKVTLGVACIERGEEEKLRLGNLDARRDWGHAADYVEGMWRILQHKTPDDFVLATGETRTVRQFVECAFAAVGTKIRWEGAGVAERGLDAKTGRVRVEIDPQFFRPAEVDLLCGDATKAGKMLGWYPTYTFERLVEEMIRHDLEPLR